MKPIDEVDSLADKLLRALMSNRIQADQEETRLFKREAILSLSRVPLTLEERLTVWHTAKAAIVGKYDLRPGDESTTSDPSLLGSDGIIAMYSDTLQTGFLVVAERAGTSFFGGQKVNYLCFHTFIDVFTHPEASHGFALQGTTRTLKDAIRSSIEGLNSIFKLKVAMEKEFEPEPDIKLEDLNTRLVDLKQKLASKSLS